MSWMRRSAICVGGARLRGLDRLGRGRFRCVSRVCAAAIPVTAMPAAIASSAPLIRVCSKTCRVNAVPPLCQGEVRQILLLDY